MTSSPPIIEVAGVAHGFAQRSGTLAALSETSFSIRAGEMVSLLGPSGCGKSTLLNISGGLVQPTTGNVFLEGQPLRGIALRKISYVFQESALFPWNTIFDNLMIFLPCFASVLAGEMISSDAELGHAISQAAQMMETARMFAYVLLVIVVAAAFNIALSAWEGRRRGSVV